MAPRASRYGARARVERRQVADLLPDGRQTAQHGAVLLVQRLVRLATQLHEPLSVGQHVAFSLERDVLSRTSAAFAISSR